MKWIMDLKWLNPDEVEIWCWLWVAVGLAAVFERLLLFATYRVRGLEHVPVIGGLTRPGGGSPEDRLRWIRSVLRWELKDSGRLLKHYGVVSTGLGLAGTLVSILASQALRAGQTELMPLIGVAVRTTVVGVLSGILFSTLFGELVWSRLRVPLDAVWKGLEAEVMAEIERSSTEARGRQEPKQEGAIP